MDINEPNSTISHSTIVVNSTSDTIQKQILSGAKEVEFDKNKHIRKILHKQKEALDAQIKEIDLKLKQVK